MSHVLKLLLGFGILIGAGFVTRPLFQQWLESKLKEGEDANKKETGNWKAVNRYYYKETNWDKPSLPVPTNDPT